MKLYGVCITRVLCDAYMSCTCPSRPLGRFSGPQQAHVCISIARASITPPTGHRSAGADHREQPMALATRSCNNEAMYINPSPTYSDLTLPVPGCICGRIRTTFLPLILGTISSFCPWEEGQIQISYSSDSRSRPLYFGRFAGRVHARHPLWRLLLWMEGGIVRRSIVLFPIYVSSLIDC